MISCIDTWICLQSDDNGYELCHLELVFAYEAHLILYFVFFSQVSSCSRCEAV
jgi:hypothetical protein